MIRADFIEPYCKAGDSIMFFRNSRVKSGNNEYKKKEYSQHSSVFKDFNNNDSQQNYVR